MVPMPWSQSHYAFQQEARQGSSYDIVRRFVLVTTLTASVFLLAPPARTSELRKSAGKSSATAKQTATRDTSARIPLGQAEFGAISTNGRWTITVDAGERVCISQTDRGITRTLDNPTSHYLHFARISADGRLAIGIAKKAAVVWELEAGKVLRVVEPQPAADLDAFCVAASPDATLLAVLHVDGTTRVLDARTGKMISTYRGRQGSLSFTEDGNNIVTFASADTDAPTGHLAIVTWNARSARRVARFDLLMDATKGCSATWGISSDGRRAAVVDSEAGSLHLYDASRGSRPRVVAAQVDKMTALTFSPDSRLIATASGDRLDLRSASTGQVVRRLTGTGGAVQHVAFSADGAAVVAATSEHTLRLWNTATGRLVRAYAVKAQGAGFRLVAMTPDATGFLAVGDEQESYLWVSGRGRDVVASAAR